MKNGVNRRDFMKVAGATAAGVTIATGFNPLSYAANEKIRVGCIGTGGQGSFHLRDGLAGTEEIEIVAIADCFALHQRGGVIYGQISNSGIALPMGTEPKDLPADQKEKAKAARKPTGYYDYKEMLAKEEIDAVVIATPLDTHHDIAIDCLNAGKYVFCEKTMAHSIEAARSMVAKCHETGKFIQVGHQRRYNPKYNLAMNILHDAGTLGRLTHITSQWHRNTNWRRPPLVGYELNEEEKKFITDLEKHWNWRIFLERSGGLYTELMTHQSDIANWFMRAVPTRVYASDGVDYWRDGRTVADHISVIFDYEQKPNMPGFRPVERRSELQDMAKLNNRPYKATMEYSSILTNAKRGAMEMMHGDLGTLTLTEHDCWMYVEPGPWGEKEAAKKAAEAKASGETKSAEELANDVNAGKSLGMSNKEIAEGKELLSDLKLETADVYQFRAFAHHIRNGGVPRTNQMVGLTTAITSISALQSAKEGKPIDIDPAWYTFDFEVPSFYEHHYENKDYEKLPEGETQKATAGDA